MLLFSGGPVGNFESLEESSWFSVEVNILNSFKEGLRVEVLGIHVELNVWLFEELVTIKIFNSNSYIILN